MTLVVLSAAALAFAVLAGFIVFYPTGSYQPVVLQNRGATSSSTSSSTVLLPSSTTSSTSTTSPTPVLTATAGGFSSEYSSPYPVQWSEGNESFSITGAALQNNQLTLSLAIKMGAVSECVPVNLRLVADEFGTLQPPSAPPASTFTFPDTQSCDGTPGATYSESVVFNIDPSIPAPFLLTTGGASNVFFNVATDTTGGVDVTLPSHSG